MRTSRGWWALCGLVAGVVGLALSYAGAALLHVRESPVVAVAEGFSAITPGPVVKWAINTFDKDDKKVLVLGILVFLVVVFALLGRLARRRWWAAVTGYVALAAIGTLAVATKPTPSVIDFAPIVIGLLCWIVALAVLAECLPAEYTVYHAVHWTNLERGFTAFGAPLRTVFEGAHSSFFGPSRGALGFNDLNQVGVGIEFDTEDRDVALSRTRLVVRYLFGESVEGFGIGVGLTF